MRFAHATAVSLAFGWLVAACRYGPARAFTSEPSEGQSFRIEDIYKHFNGPESGIIVRLDNLLSVMGLSINRFPEPDTARNHYRLRTLAQTPQFVVVHITDTTDLEATLKLYTANSTENQTSAHYVVAKSTEADTDQMLIRVWSARSDIDLATVPWVAKRWTSSLGADFPARPFTGPPHTTFES